MIVRLESLSFNLDIRKSKLDNNNGKSKLYSKWKRVIKEQVCVSSIIRDGKGVDDVGRTKKHILNQSLSNLNQMLPYLSLRLGHIRPNVLSDSGLMVLKELERGENHHHHYHHHTNHHHHHSSIHQSSVNHPSTHQASIIHLSIHQSFSHPYISASSSSSSSSAQ